MGTNVLHQKTAGGNKNASGTIALLHEKAARSKARGGNGITEQALSKLRVSVVQYLNTAPLVWGFTKGPLRGKYELSFTVPSLCAEQLRSGAVDVAIIPSIEYQRMDEVVVLPNCAIASKNRVLSLLLVSKLPIQEAGSIALDASSRSTQALVRILCAERWRIAPEFRESAPDLREMLRTADAALLIGDPALRLALAIDGETWSSPPGGYICEGRYAGISESPDLHIYDVAEEWRRLTDLPAVLAVWAARRAVATPELVEDFRWSREYGLAHLPDICDAASRDLSLPAVPLKRYLCENIDFSLDAENQRGLELFYRYAAKLGLIAEAKGLEIAGARLVAKGS
jgi:chorismate dehydratase